MNVSFTQPLAQSWARMVRMLFRPFALVEWLVLGFAALLSEGLLTKWGTHYTSHDHGHGWPFMPGTMLHRVIDFLRHPVWGALVLALLTTIAMVVLVLMWVNSRGRFVFLDDVVRERAAIVEPWRRFGPHGNSLFVFTFVSLLVCGGALVLVTLPTLPALLAAADSGEWRLALVAFGGLAAVVIPLGIVIAYFFLCLHQFVVPIMYRHGDGVLAAWNRFLALFGQHPLAFVGFGLIYLLLSILFVAVVATIGFSTCCIGFVLVAIPYVGSVLLLPFEVIFRGYGPDFLAQFGPDYSVFETPAPPPAAGA